MGKLQKTNDLRRQRALRPLLAVSLAASLAAFGCSTNLNPGSGTPTRVGPELRTAPTSGVTSGSERPLPPPMTSSYTRSEAVQTVTPRTIRRSAEEAAAIMAGHQAVRGRYLGPSNPAATGRAYASDGAGGFVNPAMVTNPQSTINSSISSGPTAAINSGAAGGGGAVTGVATSGVTAGAVFAGTGTTTAAATTAATTPAGAFATSRPAVTDSVAANPTVTAASGAAPTPLTATSAATRTTAATTTTTAAATNAATVTSAGNGSSVRILRNTNGNVTITNAGGTTARVP